MIEIKRLMPGSDYSVDAINWLLSELSSSPQRIPITVSDIESVIADPHTHILIAIERSFGREHYAGMATIFFRHHLAGCLAEIHDVVIDRNMRGRGIGKQLVESLLTIAKTFASEQHTKVKISLTSKPDRIAANELYKKAGFILIARAEDEGTNLYQKVLSP